MDDGIGHDELLSISQDAGETPGLRAPRGEDRFSSRDAAGVGDLTAMIHLMNRQDEERVAGGAHHRFQSARRGNRWTIETGVAEVRENFHVARPRVAIAAEHLVERWIGPSVGS